MTFGEWWDNHKKDRCFCEGTCLYKILMQQESWVERKAKERLLNFLKIKESDEYGGR
jgi:hypothetical protein